MLLEKLRTVRPLRSTDVTPLHRYYPPLRHPLAFDPLPGVAGYKVYLAPGISTWGEEGFSSCLACPCHHAIAITPPEWVGRIRQLRPPMLPSPYGCGLGLRGFALSGPPTRSLSLRPGESPPSRRWLCRWASGHRFPSSLPSKLRGFWLLPRWDCLPLNTPAFAGRTTGRAGLPHPAFGQGGHAFAHGKLCVRSWSFTSPNLWSRYVSGKRENP